MTDEPGHGHASDADLLAHLDGERSDPAAARLEEHLESCGTCRRRREELAGASSLLARELRDLDVEPPPGDPMAVRRAARGGDGGEDRAGRRGLGPSTVWKAAALVLGVGVAASATVPGSPVRDWITGAVRALVGGGSDAPAASAPATDTAAAPSPGTQGVSIPVAGRAEVRIAQPAPGLRILVREVEGAVLSVTARGARYRAGTSVVEVVGPEGPELRLDLPASADTVRVTSDGVVVLERVGGRVRVPGGAADTVDGTLSISLEGAGG